MVGRFQPFHLGHLHLAEQILKEGDLAVAVAGAQFNHIEKDPFTAGERIEMIHASLAEAGADMARCTVSAVENQPNAAAWPAYLRSALPEFGAAYSGNAYVRALLKGAGIRAAEPAMLDRGNLSGSRIRSLMASGGNWRPLVPPAAARVIERAGGPARMAAITETDTDPNRY